MADKAWIIDRFEGNYALCQDMETKELVDLHKAGISPDAQEGDVLHREGGRFVVDSVQTARRKNRIQTLAEGLWE